VPPTSLYRHLGHLIDAGVLDVVSERRVRGTVERTYVARAAPSVSPDDREEIERQTLSYLATMPAWRDHPRVARGG